MLSGLCRLKNSRRSRTRSLRFKTHGKQTARSICRFRATRANFKLAESIFAELRGSNENGTKPYAAP